MSTRDAMNKLFGQKQDLEHKIKKVQDNCTHQLSVYRADGSSGNWDNDSYYWFDFYCYDCKKRWSHDQKLGSGKSLKVSKIDYNKNPEIVELEMKISRLK